MDVIEKASSFSGSLAIGFFWEEKAETDDAIKKLLKKRVITKCSHENGEIIFLIFACSKHDGTFHFILHLKSFQRCNATLQHVLLKKFMIFLKFKFLKKLWYCVIFFWSFLRTRVELAHRYWSGAYDKSGWKEVKGSQVSFL